MRNPVIPQSAGDPYILKHGKDYYMSATSGPDVISTGVFNGFLCWHSTNLQDWSEPKVILDFKDVSWAEEKAWAPSMVEQDGYFYFAFCADQQIGIAVSQDPMGTFRDILGRPLVAKQDYDFQTIDPCFLKDDDGSIYLAFGQGKCMMSKIKLTPTSAEFEGKMVCLSDDIYAQFSQPVQYGEVKSIYNEAPDFIKIGDRYLFSWAIYDVRDYRYGMRYAWSKNPMGPYVMPLDYDHDNILLQGTHDITGCGHGCVTEYNGNYYITYGRHKQDRSQAFGRDMCCEKITFLDKDHLTAVPTRIEQPPQE